MVKTSKDLIEKSLQLNKSWIYLLQEQQITPLSDKIPSPAEFLWKTNTIEPLNTAIAVDEQ